MGRSGNVLRNSSTNVRPATCYTYFMNLVSGHSRPFRAVFLGNERGPQKLSDQLPKASISLWKMGIEVFGFYLGNLRFFRIFLWVLIGRFFYGIENTQKGALLQMGHANTVGHGLLYF